jgi:hypothetical protein
MEVAEKPGLGDSDVFGRGESDVFLEERGLRAKKATRGLDWMVVGVRSSVGKPSFVGERMPNLLEL